MKPVKTQSNYLDKCLYNTIMTNFIQLAKDKKNIEGLLFNYMNEKLQKSYIFYIYDHYIINWQKYI